VSVTVLADERPVARKHHSCNACGGTIAPGDRYRRQRNKGDDIYVWRCHALCDAAYWIAHEEAECCEDEGPDWFEVRSVVLRFFEALTSQHPTGGNDG
jgi:hypothetical protein